MNKTYEFFDIFKKTCTYSNGEGSCQKSRESKKCVDNKCEKIIIPESKSQILYNHYNDNQINQNGGSKIFNCPDLNCHFKTSKFEKFTIHINNSHNHKQQIGNGKIKLNYFFNY